MADEDKYATVDLNAVRLRIAELRALRAANGPAVKVTRTRAPRPEGAAKPKRAPAMSAEAKAKFKEWQREKDAREKGATDGNSNAHLEDRSQGNS